MKPFNLDSAVSANHPIIKSGWINVISIDGKILIGGLGAVYDSKQKALKYSQSTTVSTIRIEWEEEV